VLWFGPPLNGEKLQKRAKESGMPVSEFIRTTVNLQKEGK